jgi:hypothetical protein
LTLTEYVALIALLAPSCGVGPPAINGQDLALATVSEIVPLRATQAPSVGRIVLQTERNDAVTKTIDRYVSTQALVAVADIAGYEAIGQLREADIGVAVKSVSVDAGGAEIGVEGIVKAVIGHASVLLGEVIAVIALQTQSIVIVSLALVNIPSTYTVDEGIVLRAAVAS